MARELTSLWTCQAENHSLVFLTAHEEDPTADFGSVKRLMDETMRISEECVECSFDEMYFLLFFALRDKREEQKNPAGNPNNV